MLKVKHLTFFKPKNWKKAKAKGQILTKIARKIELCSFFMQPSVVF